MNGRQRLRTILDNLQSSLWFRPAIGFLLAVALATFLLSLKQPIYTQQLEFLRISVESARAVLATIAGAMLTVVGLVFSIMMVVLVLGSQQFSPRILSSLLRDHAAQNVLSIFIGVFIYCLVVLARTSDGDDGRASTTFSVLVSIALALLAIGAFIYFIDRITKTIRISYIIAGINRRTVAQLRRITEQPNQPLDDEEKAAAQSVRGENLTAVVAPRSGYIQTVDEDALLQVAAEHGFVIRLDKMIGDFVAQGSRLLSVGANADEKDAEQKEVVAALWAAFDIGPERTSMDDVLFGIRQLVDIALKAVSPGINDPTTAINCIDYISNILTHAARRPDQLRYQYDQENAVRIIRRPVSFAALVDHSFDQLRLYTRSDYVVTLRLVDALVEVAQATNDEERHAVLWRHAGLISRSVNTHITEPYERQQINERIQALGAQIKAQPEPYLLAVSDAALAWLAVESTEPEPETTEARPATDD